VNRLPEITVTPGEGADAHRRGPDQRHSGHFWRTQPTLHSRRKDSPRRAPGSRQWISLNADVRACGQLILNVVFRTLSALALAFGVALLAFIIGIGLSMYVSEWVGGPGGTVLFLGGVPTAWNKGRRTAE